MSARKAQLSWFIVLGLVFIIILALVSWLAYSTQSLGKKPQQVIASEDEFEKVKAYVEGCEKELAEEALMLIGNQGGRLSLGEFFEVEGNKVSIVSSDSLPSLESISKDVADYMDENLARVCDTSKVTEKEVKASKPEAKIMFNNKESVFEVEWPIAVSFENSTEHIAGVTKFSLPVRMKLIHEAVARDLEVPEKTDLSFVESLDKMDARKVSYGDHVLSVIIDHKSEIKGRPYRFFYVENI